MGRIMTICSGSGGVGKSTIALSLAVSAARRGKTTILLDASGISRSCDLILGLESVIVLDMLDVAMQQASLGAALYDVPGHPNLRFACASLYDDVGFGELSSILLALRAMSDLVVVDMATGCLPAGQGVMDREDICLMVTRPDDSSVRAMERMASRLPRGTIDVRMVINRADKNLLKRKMQYDPSVVESILDMPSDGCISEDETIQSIARKGRPALLKDGRAKTEIARLCDALL